MLYLSMGLTDTLSAICAKNSLVAAIPALRRLQDQREGSSFPFLENDVALCGQILQFIGLRRRAEICCCIVAASRGRNDEYRRTGKARQLHVRGRRDR
jgi:hypothetical protein